MLELRGRAMQSAMAALAMLLVASCASAPKDDPEALAEYQRTNDPVEPFNRAMFSFNLGLDHYVIKPVTGFYRAVTTENARAGVHNFLQNLRSPVIFANDLLQGQVARAGTTFGRFVINTVIGFVGFGDPANAIGLVPHDEDFGQTLAVWGVGEGPYLVIPVLGPSNPRDLTGKVADYFLDPINWYASNTDDIWIPIGRTVATGIDTRDQLWFVLDDLERSSLDYYAAIRSLYRQRRQDEINNGIDSGPPPSFSELPDLTDPTSVATVGQ